MKIEIELDIPKIKQDLAKAILKNVEEVLWGASEEDLELIAKPPQLPQIKKSVSSLAQAIVGKDYRDYSETEMWCLEFANLLRLTRFRRQLLQEAIGMEEVMELLDLESEEIVLERVRNNTLLAVKDLGVYKFPLSQFEPEGKWGIVEGLPEVLAALEVSPFVKLSWLSKVHRAFEGRTPLEMLRLGYLSDVLVEAWAVGVGW
ncbi:MAG: hypothetical protein ACRDBG_16555 [Waterburya sp.]